MAAAVSPVPGTDTAAVLANKVSLTWLSRITAQEPNPEINGPT
ncbi:MAG: hypothetical protein R2706_19760 [Acidimicrobiales bacterium]